MTGKNTCYRDRGERKRTDIHKFYPMVLMNGKKSCISVCACGVHSDNNLECSGWFVGCEKWSEMKNLIDQNII